jgi:PhnB protein
MELMPGMIRYSVTVTLANQAAVDEFLTWLRNGNFQRVVDEGHAACGEFSIVNKSSELQIVKSYVFHDKKHYEDYDTGLAQQLRADTKSQFIDTGKILRVERSIVEIQQTYRPTVEYTISEVTPYLQFNGKCREALQFYQSCLGGTLDIMTFENSPMADKVSPSEVHNVMHSTLTLSNKGKLMGADCGSCGMPIVFGTDIAVCLNFGTTAEITTAWHKLSVGAKRIDIALTPQPWGGHLAQFIDKFDVYWMLHHHLTDEISNQPLEVIPYLLFDGNCREVMHFYRSIIGGHLDVMTHGHPTNIMHSTLFLNNKKTMLMAADACTVEDRQRLSHGNNVALSLGFCCNEKMAGAFNQLIAHDKITVPLAPQFWGALFGQGSDKYSRPWMMVGPHGGGSAPQECDYSAEHSTKKAKNHH